MSINIGKEESKLFFIVHIKKSVCKTQVNHGLVNLKMLCQEELILVPNAKILFPRNQSNKICKLL